MQRTFESGIFIKALKDINNIATTIVEQVLDKNLSINYRIEFDEINRIEEREVIESDDSKWGPIKTDNLESILKILICLFIVGWIIINIEYLIYLSKINYSSFKRSIM